MDNLYKNIAGYDGLYLITNDGSVYSHITERWLIPQLQKSGYYTVNLYKNKKHKTRSIHRMVAIAFVDNPNNYPIINHIDYVKTNNNADNLEWCTYRQNTLHSIKNGDFIGEKNGNSKLTTKDVLEIRSKYKFRKVTYKILAEEYNVIPIYIGRIIRRSVWRHI